MDSAGSEPLNPNACRAFLLQCALVFALQPRRNDSEEDQRWPMCSLFSLVVPAKTFRNVQSPCCEVFYQFRLEMDWMFDRLAFIPCHCPISVSLPSPANVIFPLASHQCLIPVPSPLLTSLVSVPLKPLYSLSRASSSQLVHVQSPC